MTDSLNLEKVSNDFVARREEQLRLFGGYCQQLKVNHVTC